MPMAQNVVFHEVPATAEIQQVLVLRVIACRFRFLRKCGERIFNTQRRRRVWVGICEFNVVIVLVHRPREQPRVSVVVGDR